MCYQLNTSRHFFKLALVVVFFCFAECAAGSCMSYGHSCWGGHGKRNGPMGKLTAADLPSDSNWFLARLLQEDPLRKLDFRPAFDKKPFRDDAIDDDEFKSMMMGLEPESEVDGLKPGRNLRNNERLKLIKFLKSIEKIN